MYQLNKFFIFSIFFYKISLSLNMKNGGLMRFLFCEKCNGYYELQEGESPDDFEVCNCGGKLKYFDSLDEQDTGSSNNKQSSNISHAVIGSGYSEKKLSKYNKITIMGAAIGLMGIIGLIFSGMSFIFIIVGAILFKIGLEERKSWDKGIKGEDTVYSYLRKLPESYFVFNDVKLPNSKGNIDHIVLGPTGIFVIETKNINGYFLVNDKEWLYSGGGQVKRAYSQPGRQVLGNSMALREFLLSERVNMQDLWINSIVTLLKNNFEIKTTPRNYDILIPSKIPQFIRTKKDTISKYTINDIADKLSYYNNFT